MWQYVASIDTGNRNITMARKSRIHFSNAVYHVLLKGLNDRLVFRSVNDRRVWEALVAEGCQRFGHKVHAFCWLKGQVQLAVQVADAPLSKIMQNLSFRYTRYYNSEYGCHGSLFHGRYKAIVIDPAVYLNDLVRYIHNAPVRDGLSQSASNYKWSSHVVYLGKVTKPWVSTQTVLASFGKNTRAALMQYRKFVESGKNEGERSDLLRGSDGGRLLGDARFARKALKPIKRPVKPATLNQLVKIVCKAEGVKELELKSASRARRESQIRQSIAYLAIELNIANLTALATRFNRDLTTMSRNQRHYRDRLVEDQNLQKKVKQLKRLVVARAL